MLTSASSLLNVFSMPIKACADKLKREMETFGNPPQFPEEEEEDQVEVPAAVANGAAPALKKKGKVAAKSSGKKYQWQIMETMGVPAEEIHKFADATHWLYYFPPHAIVCLTDLYMKIIHNLSSSLNISPG